MGRRQGGRRGGCGNLWRRGQMISRGFWRGWGRAPYRTVPHHLAAAVCRNWACGPCSVAAGRDAALRVLCMLPSPPHLPQPHLWRVSLQVGYISPDLFTHSVSYFAEAPLAHHDQRRVQHIVYSCVRKVGWWGRHLVCCVCGRHSVLLLGGATCEAPVPCTAGSYSLLCTPLVTDLQPGPLCLLSPACHVAQVVCCS